MHLPLDSFSFFFNAPAPTAIYTLSLHDALPISIVALSAVKGPCKRGSMARYLPPRRSDGVESSSRDGGGTCEETPISGAAHSGGRGARANRDRLREQEEQQQHH